MSEDTTRITAVVDAEHVDLLEDVEESTDARSRSEALRTVLTEYEELKNECEELRTECDRLRNQRDTLIQNRQETQELVKYVEDKDVTDWSLRRRIRWLLGRD